MVVSQVFKTSSSLYEHLLQAAVALFKVAHAGNTVATGSIQRLYEKTGCHEHFCEAQGYPPMAAPLLGKHETK